MYTDKNPILYAGISQVIHRGTADILECCDKGIFIRDKISNVCMLSSDSNQIAFRWLADHERDGYPVLTVFDEAVANFARKRYGFKNTLECYQAVYTQEITPENNTDLIIRVAETADYPTVAARYNKITPEELRMIIKRNELFIGMSDGNIVGFAGRHLEGSIGILEVLPEYRNRGYGKALECFMIKYMKDKGLTAFCQVETDNEISLQLQKKLGYTITDQKLYFLY